MRTVIIGAGIAGLATAALLAREGHDVTVLEQRAVVGGRAGSETQGDYRFDTGPSWYLMPRAFENYYRLLGEDPAKRLDLVDLDPGYAVFSEPTRPGAPAEKVVVPRGEAANRALFESLELGAGDALAAYLDSARRANQLAEEYFLYNPYASPRALLQGALLKAAPSLAPLLTTSLEKYIAARFKHPVLRQILGYPAVFLGTRPSSAPALFHLMSALDLDEPVRYPRGGFYAIVEDLAALAREAGVRFELGARVTGIDTVAGTATLSAGRPRGVAAKLNPKLTTLAQFVGLKRAPRASATGVQYMSAEGTHHTLTADAVVSAADLHHTETRLLPAPLQTYPEAWWKRRTSGPGALLLLLGVRGPLPELPHHSLFFTRDWQRNFADIFDEPRQVPDPASIYVCKPSATDPTVAPAGCENLFVLVPLPADPTLGGGDTYGSTTDHQLQQLGDTVIDQIGTWAGIPDLADRIEVRRSIGPRDFVEQYNAWQGGMLGPGHTLQQSAFMRAGNVSGRVANLYYAGATVAPGIGVPMCLISAELVLKHVNRDTSAGPLHAQRSGRPTANKGTAA